MQVWVSMWKKVKSEVDGLEVILLEIGNKNSSSSHSFNRKINGRWYFIFCLENIELGSSFVNGVCLLFAYI